MTNGRLSARFMRWRRRIAGVRPLEPHTGPTGEQLDANGRALAALKALPERVRTALVLHRFEAWPYSRIAAHLRLEDAIAQALYALLQADDIADERACRECVGQTVRAALADYAAMRSERLPGDWQP